MFDRLGMRAGALCVIPLVAGLVACGAEDDEIDWYVDNYDAGSDDTGGTRPPAGGGGAGGSTGGGGGRLTGADVPLSDECPPRDNAGVTYLAEDFGSCATLELSCPSRQAPFNSACGCGCVDEELWCPDALSPTIRYVGGDPSGCTESFACLPGWEAFNDGCGCGCEQIVADTCPLARLTGIPAAWPGAEYDCGTLTVCFATAPSDVIQTSLVAAFPGVTCDDAGIANCGAAAAAACSGLVGTLAQIDADDLCAAARDTATAEVTCSN